MKRLAGLVESYETRLPRGLRLAFALLWAGLIWLASAQQSLPVPGGPSLPWLGNAAHVLVFGVLAALLFLSCAGGSRRRALVSLGGTLLYGLVDEWHQAQVPGRVPDFWDVCSDFFGGVLAVFLLCRLRPGQVPSAWWGWAAGLAACGSVAMASS